MTQGFVTFPRWMTVFIFDWPVGGGGCSAAPALSSILWHRALCSSPHNTYRICIETAFCESCLTFPKAWEIQMGRCLSGTGLGLAWLLGRLPALRQQGKLNQNPSGGLGHVRPVDAAIQSGSSSGSGSVWAVLANTLGGRDAVVTMLSVQQCPLTDGVCWEDPSQAAGEGAGMAGVEHWRQWLLWLGSPRFWACVPLGLLCTLCVRLERLWAASPNWQLFC